METSYGEILLPRKIHGKCPTLTYLIPSELREKIQVGDLVEVQLKNSIVRGIIYSIHNDTPTFITKAIIRKIEDYYSLSHLQIGLLNYLNKHHFTPLYKCLKLFFPSNVFSRKKSVKIATPDYNNQNNSSTHNLTNEQTKTIKIITENQNKTILLHGITSSGKTEIYRRSFKSNFRK